nr:hypothetical protein [uncultured Oscillibacter sp.]
MRPVTAEEERRWLFRVAVNQCRDELRHRRRTEVPLTEEVPAPEGMDLGLCEPSITWEGEMVNLVDHAVIATFRPSYASQAKEGQKRKDGVTYTVELTPLSIEVENAGEREENLHTMWQLRQKIMLVYQDGTEVPIRDFSPTGGGGKGYSGDWHYESCKLLLKKLVDTSRIRAVRIGELEIPLS